MDEGKKFIYILIAGLLILFALKYNSRAINMMQKTSPDNQSTLVDSLQHEMPN